MSLAQSVRAFRRRQIFISYFLGEPGRTGSKERDKKDTSPRLHTPVSCKTEARQALNFTHADGRTCCNPSPCSQEASEGEATAAPPKWETFGPTRLGKPHPTGKGSRRKEKGQKPSCCPGEQEAAGDAPMAQAAES